MGKELLKNPRPKLIQKATRAFIEKVNKTDTDLRLRAILASSLWNTNPPEKYMFARELYIRSQSPDLTQEQAEGYIDILFPERTTWIDKYKKWKQDLLLDPLKTRHLIAMLALQQIVNLYYDRTESAIQIDGDQVFIKTTINILDNNSEIIAIDMKESGFKV